ncbi:MAG: YdcF family protein [Cyanobacteria bacterium]|nr:YdcF family protein [Cyanobacteria bacterium bin.51]
MRRLLLWAVLGLGVAGLVRATALGLPLPSFAPAPRSGPQLILALGGDVAREKLAGQLAHRYGLPLMVTGGSNREYAQWLLRQEGLGRHQYQLDYRAFDTVSNFTTVVDDLRRDGVRHVLLVTSSDHMERALLVGRIVAGSRGIELSPVPVPCGADCSPESRRKIWRDGLRALVWVISGRDLRQWAAERLGPAPPAVAPGPADR